MKKNSNTLWWVVGILVIASVLTMIVFGAKSGGSNINVTGGKEPRAIDASDWVKGATSTAKAILIEYSDFQCPACASYYPLIKSMTEKFGAELTFVYRYFPLSQIHINAKTAALAAEAAGRQGQFWEMHDLLFDRQLDWAERLDAKEMFVRYARELGLDETLFIADLAKPELKEKIAASYREGEAIGVNSTPTLFLNGRKLSPPPSSVAGFEQLITAALKS